MHQEDQKTKCTSSVHKLVLAVLQWTKVRQVAPPFWCRSVSKEALPLFRQRGIAHSIGRLRLAYFCVFLRTILLLCAPPYNKMRSFSRLTLRDDEVSPSPVPGSRIWAGEKLPQRKRAYRHGNCPASTTWKVSSFAGLMSLIVPTLSAGSLEVFRGCLRSILARLCDTNYRLHNVASHHERIRSNIANNPPCNDFVGCAVHHNNS